METRLGPEDWDEQVADMAVDADPVGSLVGDIAVIGEAAAGAAQRGRPGAAQFATRGPRHGRP